MNYLSEHYSEPDIDTEFVLCPECGDVLDADGWCDSCGRYYD